MKDYYSILGVGREASTAEIANAYRQLLLRERQDKGENANFSEYSQSYRTLSIPSRRHEYDALLGQMSGRYVVKNPESPSEAEKCYLAGLTCMEQKDYQDAVDYLYRAVQLEPEESHFSSQLGLALGMFKERLAEAERYCKKAISIDSDNPDFYYNQGFLYQRHNLTDAAQTAFNQAQQSLTRRESRLLEKDLPMITPWGDGQQDLMAEISSLESLVGKAEQELEQVTSAEPPQDAKLAPVPSPVVAPEPTPEPPVEAAPAPPKVEGDLTTELETQLETVELAGALATPTTIAEEPLPASGDDDLLKELEMLEAQVRGVEDFHSEQAALLEEAPVHLPDAEPAAAAAADLGGAELAGIQAAVVKEQPSQVPPTAAPSEETATVIVATEAEPAPAAAVHAEALPEAAAEPVLNEVPLSAPAAAPPEPQAAIEAPVQEAPPAAAMPEEATPTAALSSMAEQFEAALPGEALEVRLQMLAELEREMLGEIERIRMEKQKLGVRLGR